MSIKNKHSLNVIFVLIITGIFAITVFIVLIFGANTYTGIVKKSQIDYNQQICLSYITAKIHRGDATDLIYIDDFSNIPALYIEEIYDGISYLTVIYAYEGWVRELFFEKGLDFEPQNGTPLLEANKLSFSYHNDNLLSITFTDNQGKDDIIFVNIRSEGGY